MPLYTVVCGYMRCKIGGPETRNPLQSPDPLELHEKRAASKSCSFWRRTWDSNPRGCYTLLAFQASSLATRSILHISVHELIYHKIRGFARGKLTKPQKHRAPVRSAYPEQYHYGAFTFAAPAVLSRQCVRSTSSTVSGVLQLQCPERFIYRVRSASATVSSIWPISMTPL